jgi:hypothetical protein
MTISVALFNCPHCVDSFAFDFLKLKFVTLHSRVRVRCPGCQNVVEVVTNAYSVIHNAEPEKFQWGEILEILPPDPKTSEEAIRRNIQLHLKFIRRGPIGDPARPRIRSRNPQRASRDHQHRFERIPAVAYGFPL